MFKTGLPKSAKLAHLGIFRHIGGVGWGRKITNLKIYWVKVPWVKFGVFWTFRDWEINFFGPMEHIWGKNFNQIFSGALYLVQKDQGHLTTSVFLPQGHRTRYKIIRGILDPDHPPKIGPWPWDTEHWVNRRPSTSLSENDLMAQVTPKMCLPPLTSWTNWLTVKNNGGKCPALPRLHQRVYTGEEAASSCLGQLQCSLLWLSLLILISWCYSSGWFFDRPIHPKKLKHEKRILIYEIYLHHRGSRSELPGAVATLLLLLQPTFNLPSIPPSIFQFPQLESIPPIFQLFCLFSIHPLLFQSLLLFNFNSDFFSISIPASLDLNSSIFLYFNLVVSPGSTTLKPLRNGWIFEPISSHFEPSSLNSYFCSLENKPTPGSNSVQQMFAWSNSDWRQLASLLHPKLIKNLALANNIYWSTVVS